MKGRKIAGLVIFIVGIIVIIVFALADVFGIGNQMSFGTRQIVGTIAGVVIAAVGGFLTFKK